MRKITLLILCYLCAVVANAQTTTTAGEAVDLYLIGEITSWAISSDYQFKTTETEGVYVLEKDIVLTGAFKVADTNYNSNNWGKSIGSASIGVAFTVNNGVTRNISFSTSTNCYYVRKITLDTNEGTLLIEPRLFLRGSSNNWLTGSSDTTKEAYEFTEASDGVFTIESVEITGRFQIGTLVAASATTDGTTSYSWDGNCRYGATTSGATTANATLGIAFDYLNSNSAYDIYLDPEEVTTYTITCITLDTTAGTILIEGEAKGTVEFPAVYIQGDFTTNVSGTDWSRLDAWRMTANGDGSYSIETKKLAASQATPYGQYSDANGGTHNGGFKIYYYANAGTYKEYGFSLNNTDNNNYLVLSEDGFIENEPTTETTTYAASYTISTDPSGAALNNIYVSEDVCCSKITFTPPENPTDANVSGTIAVEIVANPLSGDEAATITKAVPTRATAGIDALSLTLAASGVDDLTDTDYSIMYQVGSGEEQTYANSLVIEGEGTAVTVWVATDKDGFTFESSRTTLYPFVVALALTDEQLNAKWTSGVYIYAWASNTTGTEIILGSWPGTALKSEKIGDTYTYAYCPVIDANVTFDGSSYKYNGAEIYLIFNIGSNSFQSNDYEEGISKLYTCFTYNALNTEGKCILIDSTDEAGTDLSGIDTVKDSGESVRIVARHGEIIVTGADNVAVYTIGGLLVSRSARTTLPAGFYIVRADNTVKKVVVK